MHITNQKLRVDIFTVVISSWNMILISNDFWHEIKMYNFEPYNVLLSISTNIPVLLMTVSRVSYRQKSFQNPKYIVFEFRFETECLPLVVLQGARDSQTALSDLYCIKHKQEQCILSLELKRPGSQISCVLYVADRRHSARGDMCTLQKAKRVRVTSLLHCQQHIRDEIKEEVLPYKQNLHRNENIITIIKDYKTF